ncbi:MAG: hypothetical protein WKF73_15530 [Nocardioidaceae bacterium]
MLRVDGGEIVQTPFWSPEITVANDREVAWANTTKSFGELYGAQRGGIEVTVMGPPEATVSVTLSGRHLDVSLAELLAEPHQELPGSPGRFSRPARHRGTVHPRRVDYRHHLDRLQRGHAAFYYVRVFQIDGEMAWSSPIWVVPDPYVRFSSTAVCPLMCPPSRLDPQRVRRPRRRSAFRATGHRRQ